MADSLIAGITLARGGVLMTRNRRHFERVAGLGLADLKGYYSSSKYTTVERAKSGHGFSRAEPGAPWRGL